MQAYTCTTTSVCTYKRTKTYPLTHTHAHTLTNINPFTHTHTHEHTHAHTHHGTHCYTISLPVLPIIFVYGYTCRKIRSQPFCSYISHTNVSADRSHFRHKPHATETRMSALDCSKALVQLDFPSSGVVCYKNAYRIPLGTHDQVYRSPLNKLILRTWTTHDWVGKRPRS